MCLDSWRFKNIKFDTNQRTIGRNDKGEQIKWIKHESPLSELPVRAVNRGLEVSSERALALRQPG